MIAKDIVSSHLFTYYRSMNEEDICGIAAFYLNIVLKVYAVFAYGKLIACVILVV